MGRGHKPEIHLHRLESPEALKPPAFQDAEQFGLGVRGRSPISSRNRVPRWASSILPAFPFLRGPCEGPFLIAEELGLQEFLGMAAQFTQTKALLVLSLAR